MGFFIRLDHVISDTQKPLKAFDSNLVSQFIKATLDKGINVRLGYKVGAVNQKRGKYKVEYNKREETCC